jgi:YVTN family beta-propeller protein
VFELPISFRRLKFVTLLALLCQTVSLVNQVDAKAPPIKELPRRIIAPSLDGGGQWHNTERPLRLRDLRGKFVILDFWTYCCINCLHTLPEIKKLERAYPNEVVVIGVHSAKFATERQDDNLREAVLRYEIEHPVVNDANRVLWRKYAVLGWPTIKIIDPEGYLIGTNDGESSFEMMDAFLRRSIRKYRSKKVLDDSPVFHRLERDKRKDTPLRFPGKVLADKSSDRLFIADSGHHRIVITKLDGTLIDVVGTGTIGREDGGFDKATFDHPQGMALDGHELYVADTENHLIRCIDLAKKQVTTVAGRGRLASATLVRPSTRPLGVDLASPWDLWIHDSELYIAMAGKHQIWRMSLNSDHIGPYAGNGTEDIVDGPRLPRTAFRKGFASFAQPSGLTSDGTWLYVADCEGSSIRAVPFRPNGNVVTVVGTAHLPKDRLFVFGDRDGWARQMLLQHPLGVAYEGGRLFVADTYNHKIKEVNLKTPAAKTVAGTGRPGDSDRPPQFNEPSGLSAAGSKLYVADTNNNSVRVVDTANDFQTTTLTIEGLRPPKQDTLPPASVFEDATEVAFGSVTVKPGADSFVLSVQVALPEGWKLNPNAPMSYLLDVQNASADAKVSVPKRVRVDTPASEFVVRAPSTPNVDNYRVRVLLSLFYCREDGTGLCKTRTVLWSGSVKLSETAVSDRVELKYIVR